MIGNERLLTNGWQILKFSECIKQLNTGLNPRNHFSLGHGSLKYITAKNLTQFGTIDFSKCDFIDEQAKRIIHRRSDIQVGDILFSSRAPIGHCHLICEKPDDYDIGESIFSIRVNRKIILPDYLCLYMASDYFVRMASLHTTGSIIQEIRISDLMDTDVILPPMNEQRRIAECYKKIDRKIALNNKINDNLAQQLRLLYDYWFTQFDFPDESGNPYRSSGGQMVWNNGLKRKIPESWCVVPLGEVSSFRNGINYDKNTTGDTTYHIVNVRNISSSSILLDERELDEICLPCTQAEKYLVSNESILIARSGIPGAPRILYNPSKDIIFCGFIICATPIDSILQHYLMLFLKQLEGSTATQTGGSILKNVSQDTLRDLLVPIPSKDILTQFNQRVALIYEFMHNNLEETSKLQHLRDWLLPMLMNGQATISD